MIIRQTISVNLTPSAPAGLAQSELYLLKKMRVWRGYDTPNPVIARRSNPKTQLKAQSVV